MLASLPVITPPSPRPLAAPADIPLLLARHARTEWNLSGRYQGRADPPLCREGREDAARLAERLGAWPIGAIVASPLRRAVQTAGMLADRLGIDGLRVEPRLAEIAYGAWEGLTQAEVRALWPAELRLWKRAPEAVRFPGGETLAEARARMLAALRDLVAPADGGAVLVVTHAGIIRLALLEARRLPPAQFRHIPVEPCQVCRLAVQRGGGVFPVLQEMGSGEA